MRIIIDTDPAMGTLGGDPEDCFAIMLALNSPEVTVEGITVVQGNIPAEKGYANATHLLEFLGRSEVPLRRGPTRPLNPTRTKQLELLERRYAMKQIKPMVEPDETEESAVDFLVDAILAAPGEITLVTIGPLTNVALALQKNPKVAEDVKAIVMMGGSLSAGNITPAAEFNYWQDPDAADIVFRSGAKLTMVGLDVCHQTHLTPEQVTDREPKNAAFGAFVKEATAPWFQIMSGSGGLHLYDSLAMAATIKPELLTLEDAYVEMEVGDGPAQGASVAHRNPVLRHLFGVPDPNAKVATAVNVEAFYALFEDRVLNQI